jgi:hypothetical protein
MVQSTAAPLHKPHPLSERQVGAIRTAMRLFVQDDLALGRASTGRLYCDACELPQPAAGFIQYGRYQVCNACATEYELVRARGLARSVGQFVRDRRFGERLDLLLDADGARPPSGRLTRSRS